MLGLTDSLLQEVSRNSSLALSLHAVRTVLEKEFELKNLQITNDDKAKADIRRKFQNKEPTYPYSYLQLTNLNASRDRINPRAMRRGGARIGVHGATNRTTRKAYLFPIKVNLDLKYIDNDPYRTLKVMESLAITAHIGGFTFDVNFGSNFTYTVWIEFPEDTTIPIADSGNTAEPAGIELSVQLTVHAYAGFFRDVFSVNSDRPIIQIAMRDNEQDITT